MVPQNIAPGIHLLPFELGQAYLIETGAGLALFDTSIRGSDVAILEAMRMLGYGPGDLRTIVISHYHDDHRGALPELLAVMGAESFAHEVEAPVIEGFEPQQPPNLTPEEEPFAQAVVPRVPVAYPARIARRLVDADVPFPGARIIHIPGHTPGSIALLMEQPRMLFTGDAIASVEGRPILGPFNIDRAQAVQSVKRLASLEFDIGCFGHGPPIVGDASARIARLAARL